MQTRFITVIFFADKTRAIRFLYYRLHCFLGTLNAYADAIKVLGTLKIINVGTLYVRYIGCLEENSKKNYIPDRLYSYVSSHFPIIVYNMFSSLMIKIKFL